MNFKFKCWRERTWRLMNLELCQPVWHSAVSTSFDQSWRLNNSRQERKWHLHLPYAFQNWIINVALSVNWLSQQDLLLTKLRDSCHLFCIGTAPNWLHVSLCVYLVWWKVVIYRPKFAVNLELFSSKHVNIYTLIVIDFWKKVQCLT